MNVRRILGRRVLRPSRRDEQGQQACSRDELVGGRNLHHPNAPCLGPWIAVEHKSYFSRGGEETVTHIRHAARGKGSGQMTAYGTRQTYQHVCCFSAFRGQSGHRVDIPEDREVPFLRPREMGYMCLAALEAGNAKFAEKRAVGRDLRGVGGKSHE